MSNTGLVSMSQRVSAAELLRKLQSGKVDKATKLILLGLAISEILNKMTLPDFAAALDKVFSQPTSGRQKKGHPREHTESFITKYKIRESEKFLMAKIIEGIPLKQFREVMGISPSNANKKIRALWQRLGLENREQLIFVAGWMRLISPKIACLNSKEEMPNLSKK